MARSSFVGVDGCKGGWFSVGLDRDGFEAKVFCTFRELLDYYASAKLILVDIPIGLPEGEGGRDCDREARKMLGRPRGSSVFPTPTRQTVQQATREPGDYRAACNIERGIIGRGKGISKQTFAIAPKIAEVDEAIRARGPGVEPVVREIHPELLFCVLNYGKPMKSPKKRKNGRAERLSVLRRVEPQAQVICDTAWDEFASKKKVARDDILDALAAAVIAYHHHDRLRTLPECPPKDPKGLPMEIVYPG